MGIDLNKIKKIYFLGIKGVAMSGLAVICKQRGMEVFGSDVAEKFITDKILENEGIKAFESFSARNLDCNPSLVVIGASWGDDNIEVQEVKKRNILYITDSQMRGLLSQEKKAITVAGVHGKTTTTAMIAYLFKEAKLKPSFLIGTGMVPDLKSNAAWDQGEYFVVEGDEYIRDRTNKLPKFLDLDSSISVITSLEWEHVDVYKDLESIEFVFRELIKKTKDLVVACGDWPSIKKIIKGFEDKVITYGLGPDNIYQAYDINQEFDKTSFKVKKQGEGLGEFEIQLFGEHNVLNALAVIAIGLNEGIKLKKIKKIIKKFQGTQRRLDIVEKNGIVFIDDYAHHPTEIKTTLKAVRKRYPDKNIWCVFQPHMASRTKALFSDFAQSFFEVDKVLFVDIFTSAREKAESVTSRDLAEETGKYHQDVFYAGDLDQTFKYLKNKVKPGMVLITMGAGDVYQIRDQLVS